jgi:hypothetical protein
MDDDRENERMKEAQNELASLISCLNLGSEEMPIEEYVQLGGEKLLMESKTWLSWWAWHGKSSPLGV